MISCFARRLRSHDHRQLLDSYAIRRRRRTAPARCGYDPPRCAAPEAPRRGDPSRSALPIVGYAGAQDYFEAAAFVVRAAGMTGVARRAAALEADAVDRSGGHDRWRGGAAARPHLHARGVTGRPILLVPGVHAAGIDEPRLIDFARELAATGPSVVTAELPDLTHYQITPRTTDMIEDAAVWLATQAGAAMPATRPDRDDGDQLRRRPVDRRRLAPIGATASAACCRSAATATCRARCAICAPASSRTARVRPPHDYGVAIILLGVADRWCRRSRSSRCAQGILAFLDASHLDMVDKPRAALEFERAKQIAETLPEPARTFMA